MRHSPDAIQKFLTRQRSSGLSVAKFCRQHQLSVPTFYSWRKRFPAQEDEPIPQGFTQLKPVPSSSGSDIAIELPSGVKVSFSGLSLDATVALIQKIDAAYA